MTYNFNSRETYIEFRRQWKAEYRQISKDIRDTKDAMKKAQRDGEYRAANLQAEREILRKEARQMIEALHEAKAEVQRQYEETNKAIA